MATRNQSTPRTIQEVGDRDVHFDSDENRGKLRSAITEILKAAKNFKQVFQTSATPLKELIEQNTVLSKTFGDVHNVLIQATSSSQMALLDTLIERLEKCSQQIDGGPPKPDPERNPINPQMIDLLMIGSAGNGKSATGNSILGKSDFDIASGMSATRSSPRKRTSTFKNLIISVVDTPGVDTNGKNKLEVLEISLNLIKESLELCDYSFTALLIVIKFGDRFTQHESDTIKMIRGVLGNDVIQKYGVCVVTHGDNFEYEMEEEKVNGTAMTFEEWCREQGGEIGDIFKECSFRCVLFNNRTKDEIKRARQLENLVGCISCAQKYCKDDFINADEGLSKLTQELFLPQILEQTKTFVNDIRGQRVTLKPGFNSEDRHSKTKELLTEVQEYKDIIKEGSWQDSELAQLLGYLEPLEMELSSQLKIGNPEKGVNEDNMGKGFNKRAPASKLGQRDESSDEKTYTGRYKEIEPANKVAEKCTTELETQFRSDLQKLKKKWKTSCRSPDDIQNTKKDLGTIKIKYAALLKSSYGEKCSKKYSKFENKLNSPRDRDKPSKKWNKIRPILNIMAKLRRAHKGPGHQITSQSSLHKETHF
ncbi:unnamed protein product [Lymnaea stagnalis]|uniref:AIG1-type G domain-containing protein n=1 Tax=Lymnaea stagnalis TaxID=6523 RepID=A0AAV2I873_LYMST